MSNPIESSPTPIGEFQAHFGAPPGAHDAAAECKEWQRLCAELIAEREQLRKDLANAQLERDRYLKSLHYYVRKDYVCPYTTEELFSFLDQEPPLLDFIAELDREMRSEK